MSSKKNKKNHILSTLATSIKNIRNIEINGTNDKVTGDEGTRDESMDKE